MSSSDREPVAAPETESSTHLTTGLTRRGALRRAAGTAAALGAVAGSARTPLGAAVQESTAISESEPGDGLETGPVILQKDPLNAEARPSALDCAITPIDQFFIRSHYPPPRDVAGWTLRVEGLVERPLTLSLDDLATMPRTRRTAVLQCSGNGRAYYEPRVGGVSWSRGAIGNAEWGGVRLIDILERAGLNQSAAHIQMFGGDEPTTPEANPFDRSLPLDRAIDPDTLIADTMNGEPLPRVHGGPIRMVVPGWAGNHWIKWLRRLVVSDRPQGGYYMDVRYRVPTEPVEPGAEVDPSTMAVVTSLPLKSLIALPTAGAIYPAGPIEVRGIALSGTGRVERVEVALDADDAWQDAELFGPETRYGWRRWRVRLEPGLGTHTLRVRANDSNGQTQPERTDWNPFGYLWNGIDEVSFEVRANDR